MILFHGSNKTYDKFRIDKDLCKHDPITVLSEGMGVYLTDNRHIAEHYGKILYTVDTRESSVLDINNFKNVYNIILDLNKKMIEKK